jgi:hypothetical protein
MKGTVLDNVRTVTEPWDHCFYDYLNWRLQISNNTSKANKVLGLIKRACKDLKDPDTRSRYTVHWSYHSLSIARNCGPPIQVNQNCSSKTYNGVQLSLS